MHHKFRSMAAQSSTLYSSYSSISFSSKRLNPIFNVTHPRKFNTSYLKKYARILAQDSNKICTRNVDEIPVILQPCSQEIDIGTAKIYAILECLSDRIEMHTNIGNQRDNWNALLLNSINMTILAATIMVGIVGVGGPTEPAFMLKCSSAFLFSAATGMLVVVNKIQPSQLMEEQRNATRLFKKLREETETMLAIQYSLNELVVDYMMERILALDKAYPLPIIGMMLDKFPRKLEPAVWWSSNQFQKGNDLNLQQYHERYREVGQNRNSWSLEMEGEMREIGHALKTKDKQDYVRLGNMALKFNKILAVLGPSFTAMAAVGSGFSGSCSSLGVNLMAIAAVAGALAMIVNSIEHGGQLGMVIEMYRGNAGLFQYLEEFIESNIGEADVRRRENGELVELKLALQLGRSLEQQKDLAMASAAMHEHGKIVNEFSSKIFFERNYSGMRSFDPFTFTISISVSEFILFLEMKT